MSIKIRELTIMFSDVRNFTGIAEKQSPQGVVSLIRRIHTPATEAVLRHSGTIDKFIGDGMMATFGAGDRPPMRWRARSRSRRRVRGVE